MLVKKSKNQTMKKIKQINKLKNKISKLFNKNQQVKIMYKTNLK